MSRLLIGIFSLLLCFHTRAEPVEVIPPSMRGAAAQPQVAVSADGRVHVVFGNGPAIFHVASADGKSFSAPVKIGELEKLALGMRRGPRIAVTGEKVVVTAISHKDGDLHAWTSADAGATWTKSAPLNTERQSAREGLHALTGDGRGLVAVVWLDARAKGNAVRGRVSRDGGVTWGADVAIYQSPDGHVCECCVPNVAVSPAGEITAMWRNWLGGARDLYHATSQDGGRTFGAAEKLGTGTWKLQACPMDGGGIAWQNANQWLAVWRRDRTVFASTPQDPEQRLADNATQPLAAYAGRTPLMLWESGGSLHLRKGDQPPVRFAEKAAWASIVSGPDSAAVVWESGAGKGRTLLYERVR
jgi:hypothetical protein